MSVGIKDSNNDSYPADNWFDWSGLIVIHPPANSHTYKHIHIKTTTTTKNVSNSFRFKFVAIFVLFCACCAVCCSVWNSLKWITTLNRFDSERIDANAKVNDWNKWRKRKTNTLTFKLCGGGRKKSRRHKICSLFGNIWHLTFYKYTNTHKSNAKMHDKYFRITFTCAQQQRVQ